MHIAGTCWVFAQGISLRLVRLFFQACQRLADAVSLRVLRLYGEIGFQLRARLISAILLLIEIRQLEMGNRDRWVILRDGFLQIGFRLLRSAEPTPR